MSKLPIISGRECMKSLERAGFNFQRQKGDDILMVREELFAQVVVPDHKELNRGTHRAIIRQVVMGVEEFNCTLKYRS